MTELSELEEALASYTEEAVSRLRAQKSAVRYVSVYLMTNPWDESGPQYCNQLSASLPKPTSFLPDILGTAETLLRSLYRSGYRYRKVMINLLGLEDDIVMQKDLFDEDCGKPGSKELMQCFDEINSRYGRNTLRVGTGRSDSRRWTMQRRFLSPAYTTDVRSLPEVH